MFAKLSLFVCIEIHTQSSPYTADSYRFSEGSLGLQVTLPIIFFFAIFFFFLWRNQVISYVNLLTLWSLPIIYLWCCLSCTSISSISYKLSVRSRSLFRSSYAFYLFTLLQDHLTWELKLHAIPSCNLFLLHPYLPTSVEVNL